MNLKILVDTSVLVEYFRGRNHELVASLKELIKTQKIALCGVVISELLSGISSKKIGTLLRKLWTL